MGFAIKDISQGQQKNVLRPNTESYDLHIHSHWMCTVQL